MERERVNTTMNKELIKVLKILAIEEGRRLNDLLEEACILYLKGKGKDFNISKK
jgi:hypothetical protein